MPRQKKTNKKVWSGMPTSESELKEIKSCVEATYQYFNDIKSAREQISDIFSELDSKYGMPRRLFNFLCSSNYNGNGFEQIKKNEELQEAYDKLERVSLS